MQHSQEDIAREQRQIRAFQRKADRISSLILSSDLPWIDIAIQIEQLRYEAEEQFPGQDDLFDLIYVSRFERLREQWREREG